MKRRMRRLLPADGRLFIVAMDHTSFLDAPIPALAAYGDTCATAVANDVAIGAQVSYPDLVGFGRRHLDMSPDMSTAVHPR